MQEFQAVKADEVLVSEGKLKKVVSNVVGCNSQFIAPGFHPFFWVTPDGFGAENQIGERLSIGGKRLSKRESVWLREPHSSF